MSRGVSRPIDARGLCYTVFCCDADDVCGIEWDIFLEGFRERCKDMFPSLQNCDEWLDREDHVVLENRFVYVGISEYCGCVSMWMVKKDDGDNLAEGWIQSVETKFKQEFGTMVLAGVFSNGEHVYHLIEGKK